jgi:hypothetical protein
MTPLQDNIDKLIKLVHLEAEGAHQSIRRARSKGMDTLKKAFKGASQDEKKRQEKEVGVVLGCARGPKAGRQSAGARLTEEGLGAGAAADCANKCTD